MDKDDNSEWQIIKQCLLWRLYRPSVKKQRKYFISDQLDENATNEEENQIKYSLLYIKKALNEIKCLINSLNSCILIIN